MLNLISFKVDNRYYKHFKVIENNYNDIIFFLLLDIQFL